MLPAKSGRINTTFPIFQPNMTMHFSLSSNHTSEEDIHKSIKYNVWASTPNGNKRLDGAYRDAQKRMEDKGCKCPVFLFFSIRHLVPSQKLKIPRIHVKWHIIKDVPNPQLRHIILENNDHKPVTNSRDTQEVNFPQGVEILNIFKNYVARTSILDDFEFYESRRRSCRRRKQGNLCPIPVYGFALHRNLIPKFH
ncbi:hypothetical protein ACSQ67_009119 [Phaseolus vulgaris]